MFVRKPNRNEENPATAAVAVINDRFRSASRSVRFCAFDTSDIPCLHMRYSALFIHSGSLASVLLHTQSPPVSARIEAYQDSARLSVNILVTHVDSNNVCHGKECCQTRTDLCCESCIADFQFLRGLSANTSSHILTARAYMSRAFKTKDTSECR
jgi:hypothetical protein